MRKLITLCWWIIAAQLMPPGQVTAQSLSDSLLLLSRGTYGNAWSATGNPVWLDDKSIPDFAEGGVQYRRHNGTFKRPQDALRSENTGFGATGIKRYRQWRFHGAFSYEKLAKDSLNYTYSARPFSGNPFMVADLQGGNWKGDHLTAGVQLLAPEMGKWKGGIGLAYEAEQSARNNDPRPLQRYINYHIAPVIAYQFNKSSALSFTAGINGMKEIVEIGSYSNNHPLLYTLRGYGYATSSPVITAERLTSGSTLEAGIDYRRQTSRLSWLLSARYGSRQEDVNDGYSEIFIGGLDEQRFSLAGVIEKRDNNDGWLAMGKGWFRDGTGYDESQQAINPAYYLSGFDGSLSLWRRSANSDLVLVELQPSLRYMNYFEQIAETDWTSLLTSAIFRINYKRQWLPGLGITTAPMVGYTYSLSGDLTINAPQLMSEILTRPDFNYYTTNCVILGISALADINVSSNVCRLSAGYQTHVATSQSSPYNNRNYINFTCSLLF